MAPRLMSDDEGRRLLVKAGNYRLSVQEAWALLSRWQELVAVQGRWRALEVAVDTKPDMPLNFAMLLAKSICPDATTEPCRCDTEGVSHDDECRYGDGCPEANNVGCGDEEPPGSATHSAVPQAADSPTRDSR